MASRLETEIAGIKLVNPTMLAAGILGMSSTFLKRIADAGAGAIVTKSIGLKARKGYANPTLVEVPCGMLNAMGLPNPGIKNFVEEIAEAKKIGIPIIVSIFGFSADEFAAVAKEAAKNGTDALELNVSCPHVERAGAEIGQNPQLVAEVVKKVKKAVNVPVIVKLTPNVNDICEVAVAAADAGADAITAVNTVRAMAIDAETMQPILANKIGGLSGAAIKPIALRCVFEIFHMVEIPVIGCGGIANWRDAVEFLLAGASAVQIGTAIALNDVEVFRTIAEGIDQYLRRKSFDSVKEIVGLAHEQQRAMGRELNPLMKSKPKHLSAVGRLRTVEIQRIVEENPLVKTLSFHDELCEKAVPGQFVMVWIPSIDEVPMSLSTIEDDYCAISVAEVGEATKALHKMKEGDLIGVRGPFGKGFGYAKGDVLIVGGGTGLSPLAVLAENLSGLGAIVTFLLGSKTKSELLFLDRVNKVSANVIVATDDGSFGLKGLVTELAERMLAERRFDMVYACGPEPMMVKMLSLAEKYNVPLQVSLERLMRCAVGLCGSCVIGIYRVCRDGPVFTGKQLERVKGEFGRFRRDFNGRKIIV